jgi:hypothetical protein
MSGTGSVDLWVMEALPEVDGLAQRPCLRPQQLLRPTSDPQTCRCAGDKHPRFSRLNRCMADVPPFLGLCDAFRDAPWVAVGRPTHPEPCCSCMPSLSDSDGMPNTPPRNSPPAAHHQLTTVRQLMIKPHDKGE